MPNGFIMIRHNKLNPLYRILLLFFSLCVLHMGMAPLHAQDNRVGSTGQESADDSPRFELDEIVVTASATEEPLKTVPRNITVVTREDIKQAPSKNIVDLLSREAGINLRSLFGSDKQAVIDIRGMGATAASNVIVMVDGVRMNSSDLSGVDFSTIPLEMIERIEIADDLTDEQRAWIAEIERKLDAIQRRIDAGEDINMHGWLSENWINKVTPEI